MLQERGGLPACRSRALVRIVGPLDVPALRRALGRVGERNEILCVTFNRLPGMEVPLQTVGEPIQPELREIDLRSCLRQKRMARLEELWEEANEVMFDLGRGPLLHSVLVAVAPAEHLLLLALPALCSDVAGLDNLAAEIRAVYAAEVRSGEEPEEPIQYIDLAEWQNGIFEAEDGKAGLEFWRRQDLSSLAGAALPCERAAAAGGFAAGSVTVPLDAEVSPRLTSLAAAHGLAVPDLLFAGWLLLLRHLSGRADLPVGLACDGRNYAELEAAQGLFARFVPLALPPLAGLPLPKALRILRLALAEARQWQQCFSWERLTSGGERPYLPYVFEARERAFAQPAAQGVPALTIERRSSLIDLFHLCLLCEKTGEDCAASILYSRDRFAAADVEVVAGQLAVLLESMVSRPEPLAGALDLLGGDEEREILARFNDSRREFPGDVCVHEMFARWAALHPGDAALACEDVRLTYGELNARANRLAHRLRRMGVGPETTVALCVERSAGMIAGLLGVLKAGGAYVPLDPALPRERLAYMLADSAPAVLVADGRLLAALPSGLPPTLELDGADLAAEPDTDPAGGAVPGNLAYVIYTSGSTGRPKGVGVEHRQLRNYVLGLLERASIPPGAMWAAVSTIAADLGNTSIFGALCGGGCLHVITAERGSDPEAFAAALRRHSTDVLKLVPSHLKALLSGASPTGALPKRLLIVGGEPCGRDLVERVQELAPGCGLMNHYGPTETTVGVLTHTVPAAGPAAGLASLPLDRPLANSRVYLLDAGLRPVPRWTPGELHVAGAGLARGYLNRPDQTAERFIPDPLSGEPGARLYRTGDLARHLSRGLGLEIMGRIDHQVKIRGYRIELGEIAAVLREHAALADALVIARGHEGEDKKLVAYVVPLPEAEAEPADLRRHLAVRLPDYMLPSAFVALKTLPLTANGKVDREALPAPETVRVGAAAAPRTAVEEMVVGICSEVLRTESIGVHDSFFERGGHSLLVAQVVSRIRECFGVEISLRDIFEEPSAAGIAARIEKTRATATGLAAPPIERAARTDHLPLSFSQQRLWFFDQLEPGSSFYNIFQPVVLSGALDPAALERALNEIVRRHEVLRTTFASVDGQPFQIVSDPLRQPLPLVDLSKVPEKAREPEAARLVSAEARRPFDLGRGPLLRVSLVRMATERHLVLFSMHHVVSDAWSMSLLVRELGELYGAVVAGRPSPLPELPLQYADFAVWQRRWLSGEVLEGELAWWRERLAGMPPALEVPTDRPRPAVQSLRGGTETLKLHTELVTLLRSLSRSHGATLFMAFLAAFKIQLHHHAGRPDIVVGTNVANRDRLETEGLIGFFVNQMVLRTDLAGDPTFVEVLARVRKVVLDAVDHQHVPFEKLVEELRPPRDRSRSLLYQFKLEFTDGDREAVRADALVVEPYPFTEPPVRYDLHLTLTKSGPEVLARMLYDSALFDAATIAGWLQDFRGLLEAVAADPQVRVGQLADQLACAGMERRARNEEEYTDSLLRKFRTARRAAVSV